MFPSGGSIKEEEVHPLPLSLVKAGRSKAELKELPVVVVVVVLEVESPFGGGNGECCCLKRCC